MKNSHVVALLLASALLVSMSSSGLAAKCTPEYTCTKFIYTGACEPSKCYADCAAAYKGVGEGQCFPQQGCRPRMAAVVEAEGSFDVDASEGGRGVGAGGGGRGRWRWWRPRPRETAASASALAGEAKA
ncbi:hypothetical protein E2562_002575 [Oryza meyeriana var. granulata]|uniref:Knottin scorpion toxin-like domain-containing protein n=1 Tax=Oryza meyeriana var. granulata TaxID=110450 RepID=A0A6G1F2U4_9ORYZ|nr:hypothetical protein E2562_002575 [Oryza meyeriana var. granulata]